MNNWVNLLVLHSRPYIERGETVLHNSSFQPHTHNSVFYLVKSNQIWFVITLFRLTWHQMKLFFVANQSENCNCNLNLIWFNRNHKKKFPCKKNCLPPSLILSVSLYAPLSHMDRASRISIHSSRSLVVLCSLISSLYLIPYHYLLVTPSHLIPSMIFPLLFSLFISFFLFFHLTHSRYLSHFPYILPSLILSIHLVLSIVSPLSFPLFIQYNLLTNHHTFTILNTTTLNKI